MSETPERTYFLKHRGQECGPVTIGEFKREWLEGEIDAQTRYRLSEDDEWQALPPEIIQTQERLAANRRHWESWWSDRARWRYPALELVRLYPEDFHPIDWERRWQEAGGELIDGRMVALKDSEVWNRLGDSSLFPDGLDVPYPPFAFGAGMTTAQVDRETAEALGFEDHTPMPAHAGATGAGGGSEFLRRLNAELDEQFLKGKAAPPTAPTPE